MREIKYFMKRWLVGLLICLMFTLSAIFVGCVAYLLDKIPRDGWCIILATIVMIFMPFMLGILVEK